MPDRLDPQVHRQANLWGNAMLIFHEGEARVLEAGRPLPSRGLVWLDLVRSEAGWRDQLPPGVDLRLHSRHEEDILNTSHPPFFNKTREYDFLVFRGYDEASGAHHPRTQPTAFVVMENLLVSIRDPQDTEFDALREGWLAGDVSIPTSAPSLLHRLLDAVVDELLSLREPVNALLTEWQERLLDPHDPFSDWRQLMRMRNQLRWLSGTMDTQLNVIEKWREDFSGELNQNLEIRFKDLEDHIRRVGNHAEQNQGAIDALVQIHFAANGQRTNQVMQFLAAISAIFLPLNLLVGYFGMNFTQMPFLTLPYAGLGMFVIILLVALLILWALRRRHWI